MIDRPLYYEKIIQFIGKPLIKVITGVRRCGKSTMLLLIQQYLKAHGVKKEQILSINFESMKYYDLRDSKSLYAYVSSIIEEYKGTTYLFFDEIQIVDKWEEAINSLLLDFSTDIYITGSNSRVLSSELSTLLTGRYIQFQMQVLSFREMLAFRYGDNLPSSLEEVLWLYIRRGGFPTVHIAEYDEKATYMIINDIYDSIVLRDVVQRYNIRDVDLLNRIMQFIMDSIGSPISAKKIADYFKSQHRSVDISTIYNYLEALVSSFIIRKVQRYDIRGKALLKTQEKYYLADPGIQHAVFSYRDRHISGILENIVYLELIRRGYSVYVGKEGTKEINFVAELAQNRIYIQVAYALGREDTIKREFTPLLSIRDSYPKFVVTMDSHFQDSIEGVNHIGLVRFLTDTTLY